MVVNGKGVKRELGDMLADLHEHRRDLEAYRKEGDAAGVKRCERALKLDYSRIRKHCAEHGLEVSRDVPPEEIDDKILRLLNDGDFGVFEARDRIFGDTLFLSRDRRSPRVLVKADAKADHPDQIDAAVEEALRLLTEEGGGDVVIRYDGDDLDRIVAVRENIPPTTNH